MKIFLLALSMGVFSIPAYAVSLLGHAELPSAPTGTEGIETLSAAAETR
jgi:hypothetical protein